MNLTACVIIGVVACAAQGALAQVAVSTYQPNGQHSSGSFYPLPYWDQSEEWLGFRFESQATGQVQEIRISGGRNQNMPPLNAQIYTDGGDSPGTLLGEWSILLPVGGPSGIPQRNSFVYPTNGPVLQTGTAYYFVLHQPMGNSPQSDAYWFVGDTTNFGLQAHRFGGGDWEMGTFRQGAYSITVPGPGMLGLIPSLLLFRHRRAR